MNGRNRRKLKVHWLQRELLPFATFQKKAQSVLWSHKLFFGKNEDLRPVSANCPRSYKYLMAEQSFTPHCHHSAAPTTWPRPPQQSTGFCCPAFSLDANTIGLQIFRVPCRQDATQALHWRLLLSRYTACILNYPLNMSLQRPDFTTPQ